MTLFSKILGPEYTFLDTDPNLGENIHLLVYGGSKAYGTNLPTSDTDIRGIATNTANDILCGHDFDVIVDEKTDTVIYSLEKILTLLTNCNPNVIEILFVREDDIIYIDEIGKLLYDNRHIFLSNKCMETFGGYANQQLYRLRQKTLSKLSEEDYNSHIAKTIEGMKDHFRKSYHIEPFIDIKSDKNGLYADIHQTTCSVEIFASLINEINNVIRTYKKNSSRNEKALIHNKINKHAMHLIRLYRMASELMLTGSVCTYRDDDHNLLMSIRNGEYNTENGQMNDEFFELVKEEEKKFNEAKTYSKLPDKPDYNAIEQLQIKINKSIIVHNK